MRLECLRTIATEHLCKPYLPLCFPQHDEHVGGLAPGKCEHHGLGQNGEDRAKEDWTGRSHS